MKIRIMPSASFQAHQAARDQLSFSISDRLRPVTTKPDRISCQSHSRVPPPVVPFAMQTARAALSSSKLRPVAVGSCPTRKRNYGSRKMARISSGSKTNGRSVDCTSSSWHLLQKSSRERINRGLVSKLKKAIPPALHAFEGIHFLFEARPRYSKASLRYSCCCTIVGVSIWKFCTLSSVLVCHRSVCKHIARFFGVKFALPSELS